MVAGFLAASILWIEPSLGAAGPLALVQPTDPEIGSLAPEAGADTMGMYGKFQSWPLVSIHATLAQSGDIVTYGSPLGVAQQGAMVFDHWDPATNEHVQSPEFAVDSFCNINVATTDGRLMMAGGNSQMTSGTYDFETRTYTSLPNFAYPRWYASMIRLPDERFLVVGGAEPKAKEGEVETRFASTPEILSPEASSWTPLPGARSVPLFGSPDYAWWYPKAYLAPSGNVFGISQDRMWILDPDGSGSVTDVGGIPGTGFGSSASSVMYAPGRILLAGGGQQINDDGRPGSAHASTIDIRSDTPTVTSTGPMARPRNWLDLTVLPNGEVLASGGTEVGTDGTPVKANEIWNPTTGTWRTLDSAMKIRTYHSTALLMPSGGVFTSGGGLPGPVNNFSSQYYYPPNLFDRTTDGQVVWADRPEFRNVAGVIAHGGSATFGMKDVRQIASVSLTSAGSVTHSYDPDHRRIPLSFTQSGSSLTAHFPADATALPSGVYLLHAVDADGVPAPSQIIEIEPDGSPGEITVYGSGPVVPPADGPPTTTDATTTTTTTPTTTTPTTTTPAPPPTTTTSPADTTTTSTPSGNTTTTVASGSPGGGPADPSLYSGSTPTRILDTRIGLGARPGSIGADETISVKVIDVGGVPPDGVEAVALNVTVTDTSGPSFLTVSPHGTGRPDASNLNWDAAGVTNANAVVIKVGSRGMVDLYNLAGSTHAIIDVAGWFREGGGFHAVAPDRVLDTRLGGGAPVAGPSDVDLGLGASAVPAGADGVVFNATSTGASEPSFVSAFPAGEDRPGSSNLNIFPGLTTSNLVVSGLGSSGDVTLFNRYGSAHLIADVAGWFAAGSGYTGIDPTRILDTRATHRLGAGKTRSVPVRGAGTGVPDTARVAIVNVTAVLPTEPSFLTVFPTGEAWPEASNVNFEPGMVVPNLVFATIGDDGSIDIGNAHGEVDVLVDLLGYLT